MIKLNKLMLPTVIIVLSIVGVMLLTLFVNLPQQSSISSGGGYGRISLLIPFPTKTESTDNPYGFSTVYYYTTEFYTDLEFTDITFTSIDGSMIGLAKVTHSIIYDDGRTVIDDRLFYQETTGTTIIEASDVLIASDMANAWHKLTFYIRTEANPDYPKTMDHVFYFGVPEDAPEQRVVETVETTTIETVEEEDLEDEGLEDEGAPYYLSIFSLLPIIIMIKRRRKNED